jgi:hypothetical protein
VALASDHTAEASEEQATLELCGFVTNLDGGDAANFSCGSLLLEVLSGEIEVHLGAEVLAQVPAGVTATFRQVGGAFEVEHTAGAAAPILLLRNGVLDGTVAPGAGLSVSATPDTDGDGVGDPADACPADFYKVAPGACGCGWADVDADGDGILDCLDGCPLDFSKSAPGQCGCGNLETDRDGDGVSDCRDNCPAVANAAQSDTNGNGVGDACEPNAPQEKTVCSELKTVLATDLFDFAGAAGEDVRLDVAVQGGARGRASVLLYDLVKRTVFVRLDATLLPNSLRARLPAAGRYQVAVTSLPSLKGAYRGKYCLTLSSSGGAASTLVKHRR